jgi:hypothetical protein
MAVIHTAYATIKIPGPKDIIVLKSDQRDALACENATLTHDGRFSEKEAQELATKVAKAHGGSTPIEIWSTYLWSPLLFVRGYACAESKRSCMKRQSGAPYFLYAEMCVLKVVDVVWSIDQNPLIFCTWQYACKKYKR